MLCFCSCNYTWPCKLFLITCTVFIHWLFLVIFQFGAFFFPFAVFYANCWGSVLIQCFWAQVSHIPSWPQAHRSWGWPCTPSQDGLTGSDSPMLGSTPHAILHSLFSRLNFDMHPLSPALDSLFHGEQICSFWVNHNPSLSQRLCAVHCLTHSHCRGTENYSLVCFRCFCDQAQIKMPLEL